MKTLNKFKLASLIVFLFFGASQLSAQCQASYTMTDNGNGSISFTNTSTGNISNVFWDFGDGSNDFTFNPTHTYVNGWYYVCLTVDDSVGGCSSTSCDSIYITSGGNPPACTVNITHTVTDNGNGVYSFVSNATGGTPPYQYYWQFGDGGYDYSANPVYTYTNDDWVDVCVTVIDADSCSSVSCDSLLVSNTGGSPCNNFVAAFSFVDNGNGNYDFTNTSSGNGEVFVWNFGDGNSSMDYSPNHTFAANGTYVVVLAVADSAGNCVEYYTQTVLVTGVLSPAACNAGFTMYTDSTFNGVYVINSSTGSNLTYYWDFGDGNTSTQAYPNYTYATAGPFNLCLTVTADSGACTSTYCDSIGSGGIVLKQSGFDVSVQSPMATAIEEEVELISDLNVYPNPFKDFVTIELNVNKTTNVDVKVTDLLGNIVGVVAHKEMTGVNKLQWKAEDISNGIYLLTIKTNHSLKVKKLILNR